jgi:hypothetical protein
MGRRRGLIAPFNWKNPFSLSRAPVGEGRAERDFQLSDFQLTVEPKPYPV